MWPVSDTTWWSADAHLDALRTAVTPLVPYTATLAIVPTGPEGAERGTPLRIRFQVPRPDAAQLHLVACLVAHTVARSRGEEYPLIISPREDTDRLLGYARGTLERNPLRRKAFRRLPVTGALLHALGDEADRIQICWRPSRSTSAMRIASAVLRPPRQLDGHKWWLDLQFREVWRQAKDLSAAAGDAERAVGK